MDELIKQAESLGIKVFKSWDEERLKTEIAKVVEASAASSGDHAVAVDASYHAVVIEPVAITVDGDPDLVAEAIVKELAKAATDRETQAPSVSSQIMMQVDVSDEPAMTVINLKANPMRSLGLDGYGSKVFAFKEAADEALMRKIRRGVELGLLKVETVE